MMKLNNRGYMLVEIILASALAFGFAYFLINMTIKLKNKNDDMLAETLTATDQAIIINGIMKYAKSEGTDFKCNEITKDGKIVKYKNNTIVIVNEYADVGNISCTNNNGNISFDIPLIVKQLPDKTFAIKAEYTASHDGTTPDDSGAGPGNCPDETYHMVDGINLHCVYPTDPWTNGCSGGQIIWYCKYQCSNQEDHSKDGYYNIFHFQRTC